MTLEDVLIFITAASEEPPLGFSKKINIEFFSMCDENRKSYPTASTCALQLNLPRGKSDPGEFKILMGGAISNSKGFEKW